MMRVMTHISLVGDVETGAGYVGKEYMGILHLPIIFYEGKIIIKN